MRSGKEHHLFEALKVAEGEKKVVYLFLDLIFARVQQGDEPLHAEPLNHLAQLLINVRFYRLGVLVENGGVDEFILLRGLELHAVRVGESFDHAVELGVQNDLLEAPHHLVEIVIIFVPRPMVRHLKVLNVVIFALDLQIAPCKIKARNLVKREEETLRYLPSMIS